MGLNAGIITGVVQGHAGITLLARILGQGGRPVTQASLTSIAWAAFDLTAGVQLGSGTFAVASSVYDALQQGDPRWTKDGPYAPGPDGLWGFNFLGAIDASVFPAATLAPAPFVAPNPLPHTVRAEVTFTPATGSIFRALFQWTPQQAFS